MTIVEAISEVLKTAPDGMTDKEVYAEIINRKLYKFGAVDPLSVVRGKLRSHCLGLDFPTASNRKFFIIVRSINRTNYYGLIPKNRKNNEPKKVDTDLSEMLPEEKILASYEEHVKSMKLSLIDMILGNDPHFFEKMVVDLLLKMGYGYDMDSGIVTGRPHDGGIDGIIKEDKLGLDSIYIQAKRYKVNHKVSGDEVQKFIGAMGKNNKGVFITTSSFTMDARRYASEAYKNIQLIDGDKLAELMLAHGAGVTIKKEIMIYQIDEDYFN